MLAGLKLPEAPGALGDYVPARRAGDLVFTSGQLPLSGGVLLAAGRVGDTVSVGVAQECARIAALNALAAAATVCDLDSVVSVVKLVGYVSSAEGFFEQPTVINAASAVLIAAFDEAGRHAREAVGVAALPAGSPVEVSIVVQLKDA
jgi:enamine deaminase RidA (YjgF/YER057c/UK114 family)